MMAWARNTMANITKNPTRSEAASPARKEEGGRRKEEGGRRTYVLRNERKKKRGIDTTFTRVLSMIFT